MAPDDKKSVYWSWYLRDHISYDGTMSFMVHLCKIMISLGFFFIFSKFWFFGLLRGEGEKIVQKMSCSICQESYILWFWFMVLICKVIISPGFFIFSKFWFSGLLGGKRAKIAQNDKKFCLLCFISQELYIIWSSFVVHKRKMIISPGVFFMFLKFWFFGLLGGSKRKKWPKITKKHCLLHFISQEPYIIWT